MARFLIEVPHEGTTVACVRAVDIFLRSGSHFLTHADWGCMDGEHKAWLVVEVDSKDEARNTVPSAYRSQARVIQLNAFTLEQLAELKLRHQIPPA